MLKRSGEQRANRNISAFQKKFMPCQSLLSKQNSFVNLTIMLLPIVAICVSIVCSGAAIWMSLRAIARVATYEVAMKDMDWEAVAKITGDIGSVKRGIQTVNNRINGMETNRTSAASALEQVQALQAQKNNLVNLGG